ncbi:unnamed protein product [Rotaria sp. Silwood2]|nr:unnamed protein product [Rotaria sp. Silwood2]CAF4145210.1 unnamed protein product [Rotaria sp. Silwood2]CAF4236739.1 unnamed protein product [Rotaria sp. Silwood2]
MNILWDDSVYPFIEISEVVKSPYRVSDSFIDAVKVVIEKLFPSNLRKSDGTKILIIEKDTSMMGDLFFAHVDNVSRRLFNISSIQETFNSSPLTSHLLIKNSIKQENGQIYNSINADASIIILSKFIFFSASTFTYHRQFHHNKERYMMGIEYLINNELIYECSNKVRFLKGAHKSYAMIPPNQIKNNTTLINALTQLNLNINDYEQIWQQCILPTPKLCAKIEKSAIDHIKLHLSDYISIVHRLGNATDPVAQQILKPGLHSGQIGINPDSNTFSLAPEHVIHFNKDDDIMMQLNRLCVRAIDQKVDLIKHNKSPMIHCDYAISTNSTSVIDLSQSNVINMHISIDDGEQSKLKQYSLIISMNIFSGEYDRTKIFKNQTSSNDEEVNAMFMISNIDNEIKNDCLFVLENIQKALENGTINTINIQDDIAYIQQCPHDSQKNHSYSNFETSSSGKTISSVHNKKSEDSSKTPNEENIQSVKTFDIVALSKRLMLKPSIAFTKTDATRLYNSAEIKNAVIKYLQEHEFIKQINDLFLSASPTKKMFKPEIGYLKLFPTSRSASDTSAFETKLREKVGITLDDYVNKVLGRETLPMSTSVNNNMFNTTYHNWLLNIFWYDKLNEGYISIYFKEKLICPDTKMNQPMATVVTVSDDNVHDSFDQTRSKLTASQRTSKELKRLGAKRSNESNDEPSPKRQRKRKRFADED